jgi:tetratricopeptide (TPR) repeat protein
MKTAAVALLMMSACSIKGLTIRTTGELLKDGSRATESEPDLELARAAVPSQIKTIEGLLVSAPDDRTLLELAAGGCMQFAFGFLEDDVETLAEAKKDAPERRAATARAIALYDRAFEHAIALLETYDPKVRAALAQGGAAWEAALGKLPPESVGGLTYGGMALASAVNLGRTDPARLADLPKARTMLERAHAIDPRFYFGGAAMTLGIISANLGELERSRRLFDEAAAVEGGQYLLPRVMKARVLLVAKHDRSGFKSELDEVLRRPRDAFPRGRLANEIARRRAARYLESARDLFPATSRDE